jgi:hypothetical protein
VAWTAELKALDPSNYQFLQADAELQKGNFMAQSATEARRRLDMITMIKPILAAAGQQPFSTLDETNPDLAKQGKDAIGTAESGAVGAYSKAADILEKIQGAPAIELRTAAKAEAIFTQRGWAELEVMAGDAQEAAKHLDLARGQVASAVTENIPLPALPADLATK